MISAMPARCSMRKQGLPHGRLRGTCDELEEARELRNEERIAKAEDEKEALAHEHRRAIGVAGAVTVRRPRAWNAPSSL